MYRKKKKVFIKIETKPEESDGVPDSNIPGGKIARNPVEQPEIRNAFVRERSAETEMSLSAGTKIGADESTRETRSQDGDP